MTVRSAIQEIALEHERYYGYRRVAAELRRRGMMVNHKRVARIMRTDNLLTIQDRELRQDSDRDHELEIYLNLASRMNVRGSDGLSATIAARELTRPCPNHCRGSRRLSCRWFRS